MFPINIKLIAYGLMAAGLAYGVYDIKSTYSELKEERAARKDAELSRDTAIASLGLYQEANENQVKLISEYQVKLDEKQKKNSDLERDVAAGRKQLRIIGASCSASSAATPTDTGTVETAPIYSPDLRSNIFRIRSGIIQLEENYALCLKILEEDRRQKNASIQGG